MIKSVVIEKFIASLEKLGVDLNLSEIAVAVSGGGDSLALTLLMHELAKARDIKFIALTVEHGLREDSQAEAEGVHKLLTSIGIEHKILTWQGEKPTTRIEERAREARYQLLLDECNSRNIKYLAIAHNAEDLLETFWIRLSHASGLDGLSAIAPVREEQGVKIIRPVLEFTRQELRDICNAQGVEWFEDSSNQDEKFLRVKLRKFEQLLQAEGLTAERMAKVITKLEDAKQSLNFMVDNISEQIFIYADLGYIEINSSEFKKYPKDIQRRLLAKALDDVYPQKYQTGFDALEDLRQEVLADNFAGKTLSGCEIFLDKLGNLLIVREYARIPNHEKLFNNMLWDCRARLTGLENIESSLSISPLGDEGLAILRKDAAIKSQLETIPYKIKQGIVAIWQQDRLLSVPNLGYNLQSNLSDIKIKFFENIKKG